MTILHGLPPLADCSNPLCRKGWVKSHPCVVCNGFGYIDADSREAIPQHVLIPALMTIIEHLRRDLRRANAQQAVNAAAAPDPYGAARYSGPGGSLYRGD